MTIFPRILLRAWTRLVPVVIGVFFTAVLCAAPASAETTLLNASYDPTRELFVEFNAAFAKHWLETKREKVSIKQSHGGSGKQARAVIDGLQADVVSLALPFDIETIVEKAGAIDADWRSRLPHGSAPYTSTVVLLVRKGNPKKIRDWGDLIQDGLEVITPNPKTSGGARWNYLAAWGYALKLPGGSDAAAREFVGKLFKNVPVLDTGARGSTTTFVEREIGDVMIAWENEAILVQEKWKDAGYEIIYPSISVRAEPTVAVVDAVVKKRGTRQLAEAYLNYLYTPIGQEIVGRFHFRPSDPTALANFSKKFPPIELFSVETVFGGWKSAHEKHFADGAVFDQITVVH